MESDLFNLSRRLFENPELLSTDLPADLIRIQIRSKDQQDRLRSATAQLADRLEARSLRNKQVRKYRDVLSELEDWIEQTRCSVSAEIKFVSSKAFDLDVHILAVSSCWLKRARKPEISCKLASFMSDIITTVDYLNLSNLELTAFFRRRKKLKALGLYKEIEGTPNVSPIFRAQFLRH